MTATQYVYKVAEVVKVTDGDTYWLRCDVGFRQEILINVRLHGYDCPERNSGSYYEKSKALEASSAADTFLQSPGALWIQTYKDPDNFGRWLGSVWVDMGEGGYLLLGEKLREQGLASIWPTRWRDEYDTGRATDL